MLTRLCFTCRLSVSLCLSTHLLVCLSVRPLFCVCLPICLSVCVSVCLSVCVSIKISQRFYQRHICGPVSYHQLLKVNHFWIQMWESFEGFFNAADATYNIFPQCGTWHLGSDGVSKTNFHSELWLCTGCTMIKISTVKSQVRRDPNFLYLISTAQPLIVWFC